LQKERVLKHGPRGGKNPFVVFGVHFCFFSWCVFCQGSAGSAQCVAIHWFSGTAEEQVKQWGSYAQEAGYILLCPQFENGYERLAGQEDELLLRIIEEAGKEFSFDKGKIFLIGYSGGADFAHRFVFGHSGYVLAACIIAAGNYIDLPVPVCGGAKIYVAAGQKDTERLNLAREFYSRLKEAGCDAIFEAYPSAGHELNDHIRKRVFLFLKDNENP
jgi:predicted esterase